MGRDPSWRRCASLLQWMTQILVSLLVLPNEDWWGSVNQNSWDSKLPFAMNSLAVIRPTTPSQPLLKFQDYAKIYMHHGYWYNHTTMLSSERRPICLSVFKKTRFNRKTTCLFTSMHACLFHTHANIVEKATDAHFKQLLHTRRISFDPPFPSLQKLFISLLHFKSWSKK